MKKLLLFFTVMWLAACDEPACTNTIPVFDRFPPDSPEYNAELLRQLARQDNNQVSYWIHKYISIDNKHYMETDVQGNGLCARMVFEIGSIERLQNFIAIGGESYSGAELKGVTYKVDTTGGHIRFIMTGVRHIID